MKANELRIGNIIEMEHGSKGWKLHYVSPDTIAHFKKEFVRPIKITKAIIKDNNLNYLEIHDSKFSGIFKVVYTPSLKKCCVWIGYTEISIIEFVHELQNLYFSLTGNELQLHL